MKHKIFGVALLLLFSFSYAQEKKEKSCAGGCCGSGTMAMTEMQSHDQHKHNGDKKDTTVKKENQKISVEYTCPMHPEVKSSKPGKCPKCGMNLVEAKPEKKSSLKEKLRLMKEGKYSCCIETPCDECLKAHGSCNCAKAVKEGKPVCDECYEGWKQGEGAIEGKTIKDIKKGHDHKH